MADVRPVEEEAMPARCPWCSAPLASGSEPKCPSCGATLTADTEPQLPGVTTVAPPSIARSAERRRPNRLVQWITGETADVVVPPAPAAPGSLTPPSGDVRVEMLRLEIAAQLAERSAEVEALEAEARLEGGAPVTSPDAQGNGSGAADASDTAPAPGTASAAPAPEAPAPEAPGAAETPHGEVSRAQTWAELDGRESPAGPPTGAGDTPRPPSDASGGAPTDTATATSTDAGASGSADPAEQSR